MPNPWDRPTLPTRGDDNADMTYAAAGYVLTQRENIEGELSHIFALFIGKMWTNEAYDQYYQTGGKTTKRADKDLTDRGEFLFSKIAEPGSQGLLSRDARRDRICWAPP